jgi:hypothetical protein
MTLIVHFRLCSLIFGRLTIGWDERIIMDGGMENTGEEVS